MADPYRTPCPPPPAPRPSWWRRHRTAFVRHARAFGITVVGCSLGLLAQSQAYEGWLADRLALLVQLALGLVVWLGAVRAERRAP